MPSLWVQQRFTRFMSIYNWNQNRLVEVRSYRWIEQVFLRGWKKGRLEKTVQKKRKVIRKIHSCATAHPVRRISSLEKKKFSLFFESFPKKKELQARKKETRLIWTEKDWYIHIYAINYPIWNIYVHIKKQNMEITHSFSIFFFFWIYNT